MRGIVAALACLMTLLFAGEAGAAPIARHTVYLFAPLREDTLLVTQQAFLSQAAGALLERRVKVVEITGPRAPDMRTRYNAPVEQFTVVLEAPGGDVAYRGHDAVPANALLGMIDASAAAR